MGGQYFEKRPASGRRPARITVTIRGRPFLFQTDAGVFSREGLDRGTELLLEAVEVGPCESILDGGSLWLVARTRQGADTLRLRMRKAFDDADVVKRGSGYKVLRSVKSGA